MTSLRSIFSLRALALTLVVGIPLACDAGPNEPIDERDAPVCELPPSPTSINNDVDAVIRHHGLDGTGCVVDGTQIKCLSYSAQKPKAIRAGMDHASQPEVFSCGQSGGILQACFAVPPQAYDCAFGGPCDCEGLVDCFWMVWEGNCEEGTLVCENGECHCENVDGC